MLLLLLLLFVFDNLLVHEFVPDLLICCFKPNSLLTSVPQAHAIPPTRNAIWLFQCISLWYFLAWSNRELWLRNILKQPSIGHDIDWDDDIVDDWDEIILDLDGIVEIDELVVDLCGIVDLDDFGLEGIIVELEWIDVEFEGVDDGIERFDVDFDGIIDNGWIGVGIVVDLDGIGVCLDENVVDLDGINDGLGRIEVNIFDFDGINVELDEIVFVGVILVKEVNGVVVIFDLDGIGEELEGFDVDIYVEVVDLGWFSRIIDTSGWFDWIIVDFDGIVVGLDEVDTDIDGMVVGFGLNSEIFDVSDWIVFDIDRVVVDLDRIVVGFCCFIDEVEVVNGFGWVDIDLGGILFDLDDIDADLAMEDWVEDL